MLKKIFKTENITCLPNSLYQFYWQYAIKDYKFFLIVFILCIFIKKTAALAWPFVEAGFISLFEKPLASGENLLPVALSMLAWMFAVQFISLIIGVLFNIIKAIYKLPTQCHLFQILTSYAHNQSVSFWNNKMAGSIHSQIMYTANGFNIVEYCGDILANFMLLLITCAVLWKLNMAIVILCVFTLGLQAILMIYFGEKVNIASKKMASAHSVLNGKLVDSFSNFLTIKYFAGATREKKSLVKPRENAVLCDMDYYRAANAFDTWPGLVWTLGFIGTTVLCVILYGRHEMTIAEMIFTFGSYYNISNAVRKLTQKLPQVVATFGKAKKAYVELVKPIEIVDKVGATDLKVKRGKIEFKKLSFGYRSKLVLKDLSLTVNPRERVGIVGISGSGKTTLMNLLMRFYDPKEGQIVIDGQDIREVRQDSLRENIGFIPQDATMFNRTIAENIGYGKIGSTITEIKKAAKDASADEFIMATEKQYDSYVGDKGIKLSGGQRQRIAIARAFLKDAPILVLDEATSAVDSETEVAIQESFEKLSKGRTTIVIAHRLSTLRHMDRIVVLDKGVIVEQGTHQQLLRQKGKYKNLEPFRFQQIKIYRIYFLNFL